MTRGTAPRRYLRARLWLASAMWVPVLAANAVAIVLALGLPVLDERLGDGGSVPIAPSAAEQIFGALAAGMITFTGIIFSAVFVAAQIQTSSYSPRLAARLRRDPIVVAGLALPTATATYALFAIAAIAAQSDRAGHPFAPTLTVIFGLVLLLVTLGAFVALVQRAFELTQIGGIFRGLMRRVAAVIDDVHPLGAADAGEADGMASDPAATVVAHEGHAAVVAAIDRAALLRLARETGGFVEVLPMVGQYVAAGMPVLRIHGGGSERAGDGARRVLVLARQRTIDQDPAFALRMLVDIAIRALSPAVNDPTTAVQVLDHLEDLLRLVGQTDLSDRAQPLAEMDSGLVIPIRRWTDYLTLSVTEIREYGDTSIQVVRRLRAMLEELAEAVLPERRDEVLRELRRLDDAVAAKWSATVDLDLAGLADRQGIGGPSVRG